MKNKLRTVATSWPLRGCSRFSTLDRRLGVNLLELVIGFAILSTLILGVAASVGSSQNTALANEYSQTAREIAENEIERIRSLPFSEAVNKNLERDSFGLFGPYGSTQLYYTYYILDELPGYSYCLTYFYLNESINDVAGESIDINGDGDFTDTLTPSDAYRVLPVRVYVRWEPRPGETHSYSQKAIISPKENFTRSEG